MDGPKVLWQKLRPYLTDKGRDDEHGDGADDANCPICQAIKTLDEEFQFPK